MASAKPSSAVFSTFSVSPQLFNLNTSNTSNTLPPSHPLSKWVPTPQNPSKQPPAPQSANILKRQLHRRDYQKLPAIPKHRDNNIPNRRNHLHLHLLPQLRNQVQRKHQLLHPHRRDLNITRKSKPRAQNLPVSSHLAVHDLRSRSRPRSTSLNPPPATKTTQKSDR